MEEHARLEALGLGGAGGAVIASAAHRIPAFWFFCFGEESIPEEDEGGDPAILVTPAEEARRRLAEREALAAQVFPEHADVWARWRSIIGAVGRGDLRLDASGIWDVYDSTETFLKEVRGALRWFASGREDDLSYLLHFAGLYAYRHDTRTFDPVENQNLVDNVETPADFLIGTLGGEGVESAEE